MNIEISQESREKLAEGIAGYIDDVRRVLESQIQEHTIDKAIVERDYVKKDLLKTEEAKLNCKEHADRTEGGICNDCGTNHTLSFELLHQRYVRKEKVREAIQKVYLNFHKVTDADSIKKLFEKELGL